MRVPLSMFMYMPTIPSNLTPPPPPAPPMPLLDLSPPSPSPGALCRPFLSPSYHVPHHGTSYSI